MRQDLTTTSNREVTNGNGAAVAGTMAHYRPNADIYEEDDHVVVVTELPGVSPDDVDVTLERRVLTIRGRVNVPSPEGYRRIYAEHDASEFERVFTLSEDIDEDGIIASHKNGVLTLRLPKAEAVKPKRIAVKSA